VSPPHLFEHRTLDIGRVTMPLLLNCEYAADLREGGQHGPEGRLDGAQAAMKQDEWHTARAVLLEVEIQSIHEGIAAVQVHRVNPSVSLGIVDDYQNLLLIGGPESVGLLHPVSRSAVRRQRARACPPRAMATSPSTKAPAAPTTPLPVPGPLGAIAKLSPLPPTATSPATRGASSPVVVS